LRDFAVKKTWILVAFFCTITSVASATPDIYFDMKGIFTRNWDTRTKSYYTSTMAFNAYGGMAGIGMYLHPQFNIRLDGGYTYGYSESSNPSSKFELGSTIFIGTAEFIPYIPFLGAYRVFLINSISIGYTGIKLFNTPPTNTENEGHGIYLGFSTGVLYQFSQHFAPFITIGWSKIFFNENWSTMTNNGFTVSAGVRFFLFRTNTIE
jgi:hypothetical protein